MVDGETCCTCQGLENNSGYQIPTVFYRTNTVFSHKPTTVVIGYLLEGNKSIIKGKVNFCIK
jgi:hypothetical protein